MAAEKVSFWRKRVSKRVVIAAMLVVALNIFDVFFTLHNVSLGAIEINPLMVYLLEMGPLSFFTAKYLLVALGITGIMMHSEYLVARSLLFFVLLPFYLVVAVNHVVIFWVIK